MNEADPLKPLHSDNLLSSPKLEQLNSLSTEKLKATLLPGQKDCLKARPDGTILDGHHRIYLLRKRGVDVHTLPREVEVKGSF